jgi:hypothetical protein
MGEMIAQQGDALGIQFVNPPGTRTSIAHQASVFQNAQMLRHCRARNRQSGGELVHRARMAPDHFEDGQASGIAKSSKAVLYVSTHLR